MPGREAIGVPTWAQRAKNAVLGGPPPDPSWRTKKACLCAGCAHHAPPSERNPRRAAFDLASWDGCTMRVASPANYRCLRCIRATRVPAPPPPPPPPPPLSARAMEQCAEIVRILRVRGSPLEVLPGGRPAHAAKPLDPHLHDNVHGAVRPAVRRRCWAYPEAHP